MTSRDFRAIIKLTDKEHWGFGVRDMRRMLKLQPTGCFVAVDGARRIGLTTTSCYGRELGWIGNVVVDKAYRNKGIGSSLVRAAIRHL
jgi:predicted N-acetyltransferase YhbS